MVNPIHIDAARETTRSVQEHAIRGGGGRERRSLSERWFHKFAVSLRSLRDEVPVDWL